MFEKIPSLKDFIIYVIPGLMIGFCGIGLLEYDPNDKIFTINNLSQNTGLAFVSILFAFIIGFFSSQIQIILFNKILNYQSPQIRTLAGTSLSEELKTNIEKKIASTFDLKANTISTDKSITELLINFLKIKANPDSILYFERDAILSSYSLSLPIPLILFQIIVLLKLNISSWLLVIIGLTITFFITYFCLLIAKNFRKGWTQKIYQLFAVISIT